MKHNVCQILLCVVVCCWLCRSMYVVREIPMDLVSAKATIKEDCSIDAVPTARLFSYSIFLIEKNTTNTIHRSEGGKHTRQSQSSRHPKLLL